MADLSTAVEYGRVHKVDIKRKDTGESLGISIGVVSRESRRVTDGMRAYQADLWERERKAGSDGFTMSERIANIEATTKETLVHSIASWDWGEHSWNHLSGVSDAPSIEDRRFLVEHENAAWIIEQIAGEVASIENFIQALPKPARTGSKKT